MQGFFAVKRWSPVLVPVQTGQGTVVIDNTQGIFFSEKVESSSSHGSDMAKEWLSLTMYTIYKVF